MKGKFHLTFPERLINEPVIHRLGFLPMPIMIPPAIVK